MAATIAGVVCQELRENFSEGINEVGPYATKAWYVANWADRYAVANGLLGLSTLSGGTGGVVSFTHPYTYPESTNMFAREVSIRGVGKCHQGAKQIAWDSAVVIANYGIPQFSIDQPATEHDFDPTAPLHYASQSLDFGAQVIDLRPGTCTIGGYPLEQGFGQFVGVITMNLTLHKIPYLIPISVRAKVGQINQYAFFGCAPGTLRWDGAKTDRQFNTDGTVIQETNMTFSYRPEAPWDQILHPNGIDSWTQVKYGGVSVIKSFDFADLIPDGYRA